MKSLFAIGDHVRPKPEWITDPNNVPAGRVVKIEPWGNEGALHIEGERRVFAAHVFERMPSEYDGQDDLAKSIELGFLTIRERVANGGPGWTPK